MESRTSPEPETTPAPLASKESPSTGGIPPGAPARRRWTRWDLLESLAVFVIGVTLMNFIYAGEADRPAGERGLPGHDSFYHVKMAAMIPEHGLLEKMPWLRFVYFTDEGQEFIEHHYGFHLLLIPFVQLSQRLTGEYMSGGRWAMATMFGLTLMLFNLLLISERVPWRWLWLLFFLLMPFQFFIRHAYVRAIGPSLVFMLLIMLLMFRRRFLLTGIAVAGYTHLYLGGVLYAPLLVGLYVISSAVGPRGDRTVPWRLIFYAVIGWGVGIAVHPYAHGMFEFLKLQVFGSGLSPDISVGREWKAYKDLWWFAQMTGTTLILWAIVVAARFRLGKPLNAKELTLLLANFAFLALTCKARRFIEYWPMFCLLNTAFLAAPLLGTLTEWFDRDDASRGASAARWWQLVAVLPVMAGLVAIAARVAKWPSIEPFAAEWLTWVLLAVLYMLVPLLRVWLSPGACRVFATLRVLTLGVVFLTAALCFAAHPLSEVQRKTRCGYDLPAIRDAMAFLKENSAPGEVIFTDDWDIFPVFFYYNSHNHYIVGLDPKFTQARRPVLWERYVKISRGQVPADITVTVPDESGSPVEQRFHVRLEDLRDHFGARFVITDQDHQSLARKLHQAKDFAELVYPSTSYATTRDAPYLIFRVHE